jgi:hypothetical protein
MRWVQIVLGAMLWGGGGSSAVAEELYLRSGLIFGTLRGIDPEDEGSSFEFGGVPLGLSREHPLGQTLAYNYGLLIDYDPSARQVVRSGVDLGLEYFVRGGVSLREWRGGQIKGYFLEGLSLSQHVSYTSLSAVATGEEPIKLKGSMVDLNVGIRYRWNFAKTHSVAVDLRRPLYFLPATADRVEFIYASFGLSWVRLL